MAAKTKHVTCRDCGVTMRPCKKTLEDFPGTVQHSGQGYCKRCYTRRRQDGSLTVDGGHELARAAAAATIEDVEWLTRWGNFQDTPQNIATRLGYGHVDSLKKALDRLGRRDLSQRLTGREEVAG